ncbi:MAG: ABC transporter ATP-binding protein [Chloroflexota bacterium]
MLSVSEISRTFTSQRASVEALRAVSFDLKRNQFVTLVGPSGCGKSTLFRILVGLDQQTNGSISIDGTEINSAKARQQLFGYMPQQDALLPWRSILQNLLIGPEIASQNINAARKKARELIPAFGLAGFEEAYPHTLSGGMRQRAALLRTYLADRDILLLDEPFGALDALTRRELQAWLLDISQSLQKTILFITHDIDEAIYLGDRVMVMSPRPGHIQDLQDIPFSRPRRPEMLLTPQFQQLKAALLDSLENR